MSVVNHIHNTLESLIRWEGVGREYPHFCGCEKGLNEQDSLTNKIGGCDFDITKNRKLYSERYAKIYLQEFGCQTCPNC